MSMQLPPVQSSKPANTVQKAGPAARREILANQAILVPQAAHTAWTALNSGHGADYQMARLDDASRMLGVAGIAGLASMGVGYPGGWLPFWLGGTSWLTSMAVTPKLINAGVRLKTGVNLNQVYKASNNEIRPLFQDPNYMPLQVVPEEQRLRMMQRLGVPLNNPDRDNLLQQRLKQISVQTHTWWMLMAGMATPVLAALGCDLLEDPVKTLISNIKNWGVNTFVLPGIKGSGADAAVDAMDKAMNAALNPQTELSALSRWWKQMPKSLLKTLELDKLPESIQLHKSAEVRFDKIAEKLAHKLQDANQRSALERTIRNQLDQLEKITGPLEKLLNKDEELQKLLPEHELARFRHQLEMAQGSAKTTLEHFRELINIAKKGGKHSVLKGQLKDKMRNSTLAYVEQMFREGDVSSARRLAAGWEPLNRVMGWFRKNKFATSFAHMGDSPRSFLLKALDNHALHNRWFRRYPMLIGGFMLASTALFIGLFLGKQPAPDPSVKRGGLS